MQEILKRCGEWLQKQVNNAKADGIVLGLSGGIDSAVLAILGIKFLGRENVLCLKMPCHSNPEDEADADLLIKKFNIKNKKIDLTQAFDSILSEFKSQNEIITRESQSNLKARLRMSTLYAYAQTHNFLVCGTSNKSEYLTGYFTKFGDSGVDLMPLADFLKRDIRKLAVILEIPEKIIKKAPSAGLYQGQTDENDMGFTYEVLDNYLEKGEIINADVKQKIDAMKLRSEHKRQPIPIFKI